MLIQNILNLKEVIEIIFNIYASWHFLNYTYFVDGNFFFTVLLFLSQETQESKFDHYTLNLNNIDAEITHR